MAQTYQRMRLTSTVRRGLGKLRAHAESSLQPVQRNDEETRRAIEWMSHMEQWRSAPRAQAKPKRRKRAA